MRFVILIIMLSFCMAGHAQKRSKKCNEGCAPKVSIYKIEKDSIHLLNELNKDQENRIKVVLEGGIENVKNKVFVTSKNAIIRKDSSTKDEYLVIPQHEVCEIIVDVKTFEVFYSVRETEVNGKIVKEVLREYPPKTYMVSYERYEVK